MIGKFPEIITCNETKVQLKQAMAGYIASLICADINLLKNNDGKVSAEKVAIFLPKLEAALNTIGGYQLPENTDAIINAIVNGNGESCDYGNAAELLADTYEGEILIKDYNETTKTSEKVNEGLVKEMTSLLPCFGIFDDCDDIILLLKRMHEIKLSEGKLFGKFKFKQTGKTFTGTNFTIDGIDVERMNILYLGEANKDYQLTMAEYEVTETGFMIKQNGEAVIKIVISYDDNNSSTKKDLKNYLFWEKESAEITYSDPFPNPTLRKNSNNSNVGKFGCPRTISGATCSYDDYPELVMGNKSHHGLDILASVGTELKSMYKGEVVEVIRSYAKKKEDTDSYFGCDYNANSFGNIVVMKYEFKDGLIGIDGKKYNTIYAKFCHLDEVDATIQVGEKIEVGNRLGTCGCSGNAGGVDSKEEFHLHLETNTINSFSTSTGARKINPESLFKNGIKK
ncbi:M23 family metallopeptidase [Emticicia sp. SJ17W-69]|uniref:M23 family metallopeptidase n=1 Tax=Emticicia sp. SJ17W-69 TaxID=3421657 RepID=UPI003EBB93BA